jgi:hypothetical protein
MHTFYTNHKNQILSLLIFALTCIMPLHATEAPMDKINNLINSFPYIGLVTKEVTYGPITLRDFNLENDGRVVFADPGELINGTVKYKINSDKIESWNMHHIIVGIKDQDYPESQVCITHSLGAWDKKGKAHFSLKAPQEKGVYEVRFNYQSVLSCESAITLWKQDTPASKATVGIIVVE